jgi:hypothetical protein
MLALDVVLTIVHVSIVLFNLFGWIPERTRKAHLVSLAITAASWFLLGIWYGTGYCPLTDWQWKVKVQLGEKKLPGNFIEYVLQKSTGHHFSSAFVETLIAVGFALAVVLSLYVNFILPRLKKRSQQNKITGFLS